VRAQGIKVVCEGVDVELYMSCVDRARGNEASASPLGCLTISSVLQVVKELYSSYSLIWE
jgi:hypothetical protein